MADYGSAASGRGGWSPGAPYNQPKFWPQLGTPSNISAAWQQTWQRRGMTPEQRQGLTPEEQQHYKFWSPSHMTPPEQGYPLSPEFGNFMGRPQARTDFNAGPRMAAAGWGESPDASSLMGWQPAQAEETPDYA